MGAKVEVRKTVQIENSFLDLAKGFDVVDTGFVQTVYALTVNTWGNNKEHTLNLLFGENRNRNMDVSFPVKLTFKDGHHGEALELAKELLDSGASIEMKNQTTVELRVH